MKRSSLLAATLGVALLSTSALAQDNPGSLWSDTKNPMVDRIARSVGDIVTIIVSETSSSSFAAQTSTSKSDSNSILKGLGPVLGNLIPALSTGANGSSTGQGSTTQTGKLSARITATIKTVLPNGILILEGTKTVTVNKEVQTIKLTGMIRRDDIRSDNTVLSENIADAFIVTSGKGAIADRQRRGFLTRILDWLF
ncbi:MAG: flagellar basal body L-ring protein FlgH [Fimbriimonadales bacterium]